MRDLMKIVEAPLADIQVHGDLSQEGSFSPNDRRHIQKSILKGVYKKKLARIPFNLYVYVLNAKGLENYGRSYPESEFLPSTHHAVINYMDDEADHARLNDVNRAIAVNRQRDPKGVHFILADNYSEDDQMPPTAWIILHRLMHCLTNVDDVRDLKRDILHHRNGRIEVFLSDILTMQSAVSKRMAGGEECAEMATQYVLTGDIPLRNLNMLDRDGIKLVKAHIQQFKHLTDERIADMAGKTFYI